MWEFAQDFGGAPILISVVCKQTTNYMDAIEFLLATADVQNFLLAAWAKELGSVWLSVGLLPETKGILGIKQGQSIIAVLAIGYIKTTSTAPPRAKVDLQRLL